MLDGSCHCGALTIQLDTARAPAELPVRICGCTFCRKHRPRYTSDPAGHVAIGVARAASVSRYRFGLRSAEFLICQTCGVFVAAVAAGPPARAVINLDVLARSVEFVGAPTQFSAYDAEDLATRAARRATAWTPATITDG